MVEPVSAIILVFAFVLFVISAWPAVAPYWNRIISIGLACWVLTEILRYTGHLLK